MKIIDSMDIKNILDIFTNVITKVGNFLSVFANKCYYINQNILVYSKM